MEKTRGLRYLDGEGTLAETRHTALTKLDRVTSQAFKVRRSQEPRRRTVSNACQTVTGRPTRNQGDTELIRMVFATDTLIYSKPVRSMP